MNSILQVFLGGMVGTFLRFIVSTFIPSVWMLLIVNFFGSLLLGAISRFYEKKDTEKWKLFLTTGMLGSFTTFSSFSEQWFLLLEDNLLFGCCYGIGMMVLCVFAAFVGYKLMR